MWYCSLFLGYFFQHKCFHFNPFAWNFRSTRIDIAYIFMILLGDNLFCFI